MLFVVPNSGGLPEPEQALLPTSLTETWSPESRAASAAVRRARAKYPTGDDKKKRNRNRDASTPAQINDATVKQVGDKVKARTKAEHDAQKTATDSFQKIHADKEKVKADAAKATAAAAKKAASGGKGGGAKAPTATDETKNANGERVIKYSDGSTVTVHKDGKTATHTKADGSSMTGKYHDPTPAAPKDTPKGFKADTPASKAAERAKADKAAAADAKKRARAAAAKPKKQKVLRVKLSRTKLGPRANA